MWTQQVNKEPDPQVFQFYIEHGKSLVFLGRWRGTRAPYIYTKGIKVMHLHMFHTQDSQGHFAKQQILLNFTRERRRLFIIFPVYFGHPVACFCNVSEDEEHSGPAQCS